jgi:hypothetical protein
LLLIAVDCCWTVIYLVCETKHIISRQKQNKLKKYAMECNGNALNRTYRVKALFTLNIDGGDLDG